MVNMFSMYSGMGGAMNSSNVPQYLKQRYGNGYPDFGVQPYKQGYPMGIAPREKPNVIQQSPLIRFLRSLFC